MQDKSIALLGKSYGRLGTITLVPQADETLNIIVSGSLMERAVRELKMELDGLSSPQAASVVANAIRSHAAKLELQDAYRAQIDRERKQRVVMCAECHLRAVAKPGDWCDRCDR